MKSNLRYITALTVVIMFSIFALREASFAAQTNQKEDPTKSMDDIVLESNAAKKFKEKDYEGALQEFEELDKQYPDSPLIMRYIGVTLNELGRPKEAIEYFKKAIAINPRNAAIRYHLARSYQMMDDLEATQTQLFYVLDYPDKAGYYEDLATIKLNELGIKIPGKKFLLPMPEKKPWTVFGGFGYEYDDNVSLSSGISTFQLPGNTRADRFKINAGVNYDFINNPKGKAAVSYQFRQNFHDNAMDQYNFRTHEVATHLHYNTIFFDKPTRFTLRYVFAHGTLYRRTFSSSNAFFPTVTMKLADDLFGFIDVVGQGYDYFWWARFRNKGFEPSISSRSGFYNVAGGSVTLFATLFDRQCHFTTAYEFQNDDTVGRDFDTVENVVRWIIHIPVIEKFESDTIFEYHTFDYFKFALEPKRYDKQFYFGFKLSRPLNKYMTISGYYNYTDNRSDNDYIRGVFTYDRHWGGVELSFKY